MSFGIVGYSQAGDLSQPSPSIWGDCKSAQLIDESSGFFCFRDFDDDVSLPGMPNATAGHVNVSTLYNTNYDTVLQITSGATLGDGSMIFTRPLGPIVPSSGKKFWAEICFALNSVTATNAFFFGLIGGPVLVGGAIKAGGLPVTTSAADPKASVVTAVNVARTTNTITTNSLIGFVGTPTGAGGQVKVDALYLNQPTYNGTATALPATSSTVTTLGTPIYVKTDVLNATLITTNLPTGTTLIGGFPGDLTAYVATPTATSQLVNNGFVKLGIRFDGQSFLYFYVNGVVAAKVQVDSTFDQVSDYGVAYSVTDGAGASVITQVEFFRAAAQVRN